MRDTDFSCHSLRWEVELTLEKENKRNMMYSFTKDSNLHEASEKMNNSNKKTEEG